MMLKDTTGEGAGLVGCVGGAQDAEVVGGAEDVMVLEDVGGSASEGVEVVLIKLLATTAKVTNVAMPLAQDNGRRMPLQRSHKAQLAVMTATAAMSRGGGHYKMFPCLTCAHVYEVITL